MKCHYKHGSQKICRENKNNMSIRNPHVQAQPTDVLSADKCGYSSVVKCKQ